MMRQHASQSGQVALIVLLVMSLTLVVALSMARRTTQDVVRTTQNSESAQIYSAAQSVAEEQLTEVLTAMRNGEPIVPTDPAAEGEAIGGVPGGAGVVLNNANVITEIQTPVNFVQPLAQGEALQISMDDDLTLEWGSSDTPCDDASLLISEYYDNGGQTQVRYTAVAPNGCSRGDSIPSGSVGSNYNTLVSIPFISSLFVRVIPLYTSTDLYVEGASAGQFVRIIATAVNERGEDDETGAVEVTTTDLQAPGFLDYALYSGGSIIKN